MNFKMPQWPAWAHIPPISFIWHDMLWLLLIIPAAVALHIFVQDKRRRDFSGRFASLGKLKIGLGNITDWRRHVPPVLYAIGLALTLFAIARPTALIMTSSNRATVMLTMDVSGSMRADDMKPSRIEAAQDAAKTFIKDQPKEVQIGIVAFAATAQLVQQPTTDHAALIAAIDRFELQRGTAVGSGLLKTLATLFPGEEFDVSGRDMFFQGGGGVDTSQGGGKALGGDTGTAPTLKKPDPVEPGSLKTAIVILMTDGNTRIGPDPVDVARIAADHGLRVYTIGFGSKGGADAPGFGAGYRASLNEEPLKRVADVTRGKYYFANSAEELKKVYQNLSKQRIVSLQETEITSFVAALAAMFTLVSATLSMLWFNRIY